MAGGAATVPWALTVALLVAQSVACDAIHSPTAAVMHPKSKRQAPLMNDEDMEQVMYPDMEQVPARSVLIGSDPCGRACDYSLAESGRRPIEVVRTGVPCSCQEPLPFAVERPPEGAPERLASYAFRVEKPPKPWPCPHCPRSHEFVVEHAAAPPPPARTHDFVFRVQRPPPPCPHRPRSHAFHVQTPLVQPDCQPRDLPYAVHAAPEPTPCERRDGEFSVQRPADAPPAPRLCGLAAGVDRVALPATDCPCADAPRYARDASQAQEKVSPTRPATHTHSHTDRHSAMASSHENEQLKGRGTENMADESVEEGRISLKGSMSANVQEKTMPISSNTKNVLFDFSGKEDEGAEGPQRTFPRKRGAGDAAQVDEAEAEAEIEAYPPAATEVAYSATTGGALVLDAEVFKTKISASGKGESDECTKCKSPEKTVTVTKTVITETAGGGCAASAVACDPPEEPCCAGAVAEAGGGPNVDHEHSSPSHSTTTASKSYGSGCDDSKESQYSTGDFYPTESHYKKALESRYKYEPYFGESYSYGNKYVSKSQHGYPNYNGLSKSSSYEQSYPHKTTSRSRYAPYDFPYNYGSKLHNKYRYSSNKGKYDSKYGSYPNPNGYGSMKNKYDSMGHYNSQYGQYGDFPHKRGKCDGAPYDCYYSHDENNLKLPNEYKTVDLEHSANGGSHVSESHLTYTGDKKYHGPFYKSGYKPSLGHSKSDYSIDYYGLPKPKSYGTYSHGHHQNEKKNEYSGNYRATYSNYGQQGYNVNSNKAAHVKYFPKENKHEGVFEPYTSGVTVVQPHGYEGPISYGNEKKGYSGDYQSSKEVIYGAGEKESRYEKEYGASKCPSCGGVPNVGYGISGYISGGTRHADMSSQKVITSGSYISSKSSYGDGDSDGSSEREYADGQMGSSLGGEENYAASSKDESSSISGGGTYSDDSLGFTGETKRKEFVVIPPLQRIHSHREQCACQSTQDHEPCERSWRASGKGFEFGLRSPKCHKCPHSAVITSDEPTSTTELHNNEGGSSYIENYGIAKEVMGGGTTTEGYEDEKMVTEPTGLHVRGYSTMDLSYDDKTDAGSHDIAHNENKHIHIGVSYDSQAKKDPHDTYELKKGKESSNSYSNVPYTFARNNVYESDFKPSKEYITIAEHIEPAYILQGYGVYNEYGSQAPPSYSTSNDFYSSTSMQSPSHTPNRYVSDDAYISGTGYAGVSHPSYTWGTSVDGGYESSGNEGYRKANAFSEGATLPGSEDEYVDGNGNAKSNYFTPSSNGGVTKYGLPNSKGYFSRLNDGKGYNILGNSHGRSTKIGLNDLRRLGSYIGGDWLRLDTGYNTKDDTYAPIMKRSTSGKVQLVQNTADYENKHVEEIKFTNKPQIRQHVNYNNRHANDNQFHPSLVTENFIPINSKSGHSPMYLSFLLSPNHGDKIRTGRDETKDRNDEVNLLPEENKKDEPKPGKLKVKNNLEEKNIALCEESTEKIHETNSDKRKDQIRLSSGETSFHISHGTSGVVTRNDNKNLEREDISTTSKKNSEDGVSTESYERNDESALNPSEPSGPKESISSCETIKCAPAAMVGAPAAAVLPNEKSTFATGEVHGEPANEHILELRPRSNGNSLRDCVDELLEIVEETEEGREIKEKQTTNES